MTALGVCGLMTKLNDYLRLKSQVNSLSPRFDAFVLQNQQR